MKNNPILVTGIHRSGSTFTGKMLTQDSRVGYIQEPYNKVYGLEIIDKYFQYTTSQNISVEMQQALDDLIYLRKATYKISSETDFDRSLNNRWELLKELVENRNIRNTLDYAGKFVFRSRAQLQFYLAKYNPLVMRVLLKDPIACLSSQYLHRTYNMDVVVLIRHPLSFIASIKRLEWGFNFNNFLEQKDLMSDHLNPYREEIEKINNRQDSKNIVEKGCLLWNCIYKVLSTYIDQNPSFIVCKHEDIATRPVASFEQLYKKLGLNLTPGVIKKIKEYTSCTNSIAALQNSVHQLKRDSSKITDQWKSILDEDEIVYIKGKTDAIASLFYDQEI